MNREWSRRSMLGAALAAGVSAPAVMASAIAQEKSAAKNRLTDESLGTLLKAMGIEAKLIDKRYDFNFKSNINNEEWELSMSAVLSQDGGSVWIMAWLDELPKSAADVPRTALLRLLADNDKLGRGKFFAYIATNRRFVLQRVVPNDAVTSASFRADLDDLGSTVVATYPHWSVANWSSTTQPDPAQAQQTGAPVKGSTRQGASTTPAPQAAVNPNTPAVRR